MNEFRRLKDKYEDINKTIRSLQKEQKDIRNKIEEVCPHSNIVQIDEDPYIKALGDSQSRYKCKDCFRYFTGEELDNYYNK